MNGKQDDKSNILQQQLKNALLISNLGMWTWDLATNLVSFDGRARQILGMEESKSDLKVDAFLHEYIHPESINDIQKAIKKAHEGIIFNNRYRILHPEKDELWVKLHSQRIADSNGDKIIGVVMDVTDTVVKERQLIGEADFLRELLEIITYPIFYKDKAGLYTHFNKAFLDFIGLESQEILNKSVYDVAPKDLADIYKAADDDLMLRKDRQVYESQVKYADGSIHDVIFTKAVHLDDQDDALGLVGVMHDVTDQREAERRFKGLHEAKDVFMRLTRSVHQYEDKKTFLNQVLKAFSTIFSSVDKTMLLHYDNHQHLSLYLANDIDDTDLDVSVDIHDTFLFNVIQGGLSKVFIENALDPTILTDKDPGRQFLLHNDSKSMLVIPIPDDEDSTWFFMYFSPEVNGFTYSDIMLSEYIKDEISIVLSFYKMYQNTLKLASYDGLTDLLNRHSFDKALKSALEADLPFTIVLFDLDKLKYVNDNFGHEFGDQYITLLSQLMSAYLSKGLLGRIGGDEFAAIIQDTDDLNSRLEAMRKDFIEKIDHLSNGAIHTAFSYGLANFPKDGKAAKTLYRHADQKMYAFKKHHES